ncbi:hypothetical protein VV01_12075 [Luteipulveratus halotolerans]|uniref:Polymerase nucleotidyl transferase domain-containing protein n=1 Tax=Luteipulveratus halotolerans TaxID=1631356 RepID=A0A0L6CPF9_9MICO|nr:hypothetical protein VV01_12075 [Luteipulveratus halotolerans]
MQRFPDAECAWLGGSVVRGTATATSDLDVLVLLNGHPAPFRESVTYDGVPVELFVQTHESLRRFRDEDQRRRQPTTARLVADTARLLGDAATLDAVERECRAEIEAGPRPLSPDEIDRQRYVLTDLVDDLTEAPSAEATLLVAMVLEGAIRLLLGLERHWQGTGKGLVRELEHWYATGADDSGVGALLLAALEDPRRLAVEAAEDVLNGCGGRLFEGYRIG